MSVLNNDARNINAKDMRKFVFMSPMAPTIVVMVTMVMVALNQRNVSQSKANTSKTAFCI